MPSEAPTKVGFKAQLQASSKPSKPSATSSAKPSPSPAPSQTSNSGEGSSDRKRKRQDAPNVVYSQPALTGTGGSALTKVHYAVTWLKERGKPQKFPDISGYLSIVEDEKYLRRFSDLLQCHPRVTYDRAQRTYKYRPIHDINSEQQLLGFMQAQTTAKGLSVAELKDGWPDAQNAINNLEAKGKVLATRNKKDSTPKVVWPDDPSLRFTIDEEFQDIWHKIRIPGAEAVADALEKEGLTPANKTRHVKKAPQAPEKKKKRAPRAGGRTTNKHMEGLLKDYSHMRK